MEQLLYYQCLAHSQHTFSLCTSEALHMARFVVICLPWHWMLLLRTEYKWDAIKASNELLFTKKR